MEGELDGEFLFLADPSQFKFTTWSDKVVVIFKQKLQLKICVIVKFWYDFGLEVHLTAYISLHFLRFHWLKTPVKGMHKVYCTLQGILHITEHTTHHYTKHRAYCTTQITLHFAMHTTQHKAYYTSKA